MRAPISGDYTDASKLFLLLATEQTAFSNKVRCIAETASHEARVMLRKRGAALQFKPDEGWQRTAAAENTLFTLTGLAFSASEYGIAFCLN